MLRECYKLVCDNYVSYRRINHMVLYYMHWSSVPSVRTRMTNCHISNKTQWQWHCVLGNYFLGLSIYVYSSLFIWDRSNEGGGIWTANTTHLALAAGFHTSQLGSCDLQDIPISAGFHTIILWLGKTNKANFYIHGDTLKRHFFLWLCQVKKWKVWRSIFLIYHCF
jgi:hypothetical protein